MAKWLGTFYSSIFRSSSPKEAVEWFLQGRGHFQPSWRAVIFAVDGVGKTPIANHIRSYGEPVQGRYTYTHLHTNTYTHTIPRHVYHHSSVGCSTIHILYIMWIGKKFSPISPLALIGENFITLVVIVYNCIEDMVIFIALAKIYFKFLCNMNVAA